MNPSKSEYVRWRALPTSEQTTLRHSKLYLMTYDWISGRYFANICHFLSPNYETAVICFSSLLVVSYSASCSKCPYSETLGLRVTDNVLMLNYIHRL
jgi:hypothetical protein